jgi:hypothetical protein
MKKNYFIYLLLLISFPAMALKPLEGIILGDIKQDQIFDPLDNVFDKRYSLIDNSDVNIVHREQVKHFSAFHDEGENLRNSCDSVEPSVVYSTTKMKIDATQSVMATLQYIGLDVTTRAIGKYAKELNIEESDYLNLVNNLIGNYCSRNLSVISLRLLKKNLLEKYFGENHFFLPNIADNIYFPTTTRLKLETNPNHFREFALTVRNFKAFCSFGADIDKPRLLLPYLKNQFIMAFIMRNLIGKRIIWDDENKKSIAVRDPYTIKTTCDNLICRLATTGDFNKKFPRMVGSTSIEGDLKRLYCHHFKIKDLSYEDNENVVNEWLDMLSFDEVNLELMNFISLLTGVPDLLISSQAYSDLVDELRGSIEQKWTDWAVESTNRFSKDLLYEEELQINLASKPIDDVKVRRGEFEIIFEVNQGEIDKQVDHFDKLDVYFNLYFPKSFLRWARGKWETLVYSQDEVVKEDFIKLIESYLVGQLDLQKDLFLVAPFGAKIYRDIVIELLAQLRSYEGTKFNDLSNTTFTIPVKFHYGLFALKYFRYQFKRKYRAASLPATIKTDKEELEVTQP